MANTYYDSQLTAEEIEQVLEAISGILTSANNGKVLAISDGTIEARSVQWGGGEPTIEPLSATQNGTYNPPSGVDGYAPVTVNVSGGSGGTIYYGTDAPTSLIGDDGDTYVQYHSGIRVLVTTTGGYNGGAVIAVEIDGTQVFTATGNSPYNLVYDNTQADVTTEIGTVHIEVTPPTTSSGELYIIVTGPANSVTSNPPKQGPNSSYGYGNYSNSFSLDGAGGQVRIADALFIKQSGVWKGAGDEV